MFVVYFLLDFHRPTYTAVNIQHPHSPVSSNVPAHIKLTFGTLPKILTNID